VPGYKDIRHSPEFIPTHYHELCGFNRMFETTYCMEGHIAYAETGIVDTSQ